MNRFPLHLLLCFVIFLTGGGWAQTPSPSPTPSGTPNVQASPSLSPTPVSTPIPAPSSIPTVVPADFVDPETSFENFMAHMALATPLRPDQYVKASYHLDLSGLPTVARSERGIKLSQQLYWVLQSSDLDLEQLKNSEGLDSISLYKQPSGDAVKMTRAEDGRWLFSSTTVDAVPRMYEVLAEKGKIQNWYLESLNFQILGMNANLWAALLLLPLVAYLLGSFVVMVLRIPLRTTLLEKVWMTEEKMKPLLKPVGWIVASIFTWLVLSLLDIPAGLLVLLTALVKIVATGAVLIGLFRLSDLGTVYAEHFSAGTDTKLDDMLVPLVRRSFKVGITIIAILFLGQNLNVQVWSLFAGFSVFGAMVALAGQDMVKNFFGSITVLTDQPFTVGDWVVVSGIEGVVEDVGFRSTRIRTFYDSVVTLPNSQLLTASVDNYGRRNYRRYTKKIAIRRDTPPEIAEAYCEGIREIVRRHPYTRKDSFQVWVNDMNEYSLEILLYIFWKAPDWDTELRERHRFLLDIHRLAGELKVEIAYPSQRVLWSKREDDFVTEFEVERRERAQESGRDAARKLLESSLASPESSS